MPDQRAGGMLQQMAQLQDTVNRLEEKVDKQGEQLVRLEPLPGKVTGLSKGAKWLGALIVTSSIGFAFSVLLLIPPG